MIGTLSGGVARTCAPNFGWWPRGPLPAEGFVTGRIFLLLDMGGM